MEFESIEDEQETSQAYDNGYWWARFAATADQLLIFPAFYKDVWENLLGCDEVDENELVESVRRFLIAGGSKSAAYKWIEENLMDGCFGDEHYQCIAADNVSDFIDGAMASGCNILGDFAKAAERCKQPA